MENFVVSARKYRPQTFASVVGQGHITSTLVNAISRGQLSHAYLFCGPRGVGKTTCARIFAKTINCLSLKNGEACDECDSCRGFNESRSFNIHETDAASNNSVDDIRNLTDQVRIPPQIGKYSVYIIDEVHMLSSQAFNAFLKTLEEPPAHAIFILATTEKHKILPTILSRCQIFDFNRIKVEDTVDYLKYIAEKENVSADEHSLSLIANKADGGMRDALSMFDKVVSFCGTTLDYKRTSEAMNVLDYETYFSLTDTLIKGDYPEALLVFDKVLKNGFSPQTFLSGLSSHFRDLLMSKSEQTVSLLELTQTLRQRYKTQSGSLEITFLFAAINLLVQTESGLKTASSQRLNVELSLMKLCRLGQKKNNDTLDEPYLLPELIEKLVQGKPIAQIVAPKTQVEVKIAEPKPEPKPKHDNKVSVSITGMSINSILNAKNQQKQEPKELEVQEVRVDADSEKKINDVKEDFVKNLSQKRPRLGIAFSQMEVEGNIIKIEVPSLDLKHEIERTQSEVLTFLAKQAGVNGLLQLEIKVAEKLEGFLPIKADDKLKFLIDKNPLLNKLRMDLDLDFD